MQTKESKPSGFLLFTIFAIACILLAFVATIVFGDSCPALSCGTIKRETVVANEEYEWTYDDEIGRLIREAEMPKSEITDCATIECYKSHPDYTYDPAIEKQKVVANVISKEVKRDNYTIRVGLEGRMKPFAPLTATTTQGRAKEWLDRAGLGYTLRAWIMFGEQDKIDYVLPICVAWADSHLGKALASKNNIGNVGNDDRGRRVEYESMEDGINAIFRALNNKWMGGSTIVGQLSGEGRKRLGIEGCTAAKVNQKCYATSMGVWSTNVTNCLSAIYDRQINESFEFRLK